jgi:hypothetical protein
MGVPVVEGASRPVAVMFASLRQIRRARRLRRSAADLATRVLNHCSDSTDVVLMPQQDTRPTTLPSPSDASAT